MNDKQEYELKFKNSNFWANLKLSPGKLGYNDRAYNKLLVIEKK